MRTQVIYTGEQGQARRTPSAEGELREVTEFILAAFSRSCSCCPELLAQDIEARLEHVVAESLRVGQQDFDS